MKILFFDMEFANGNIPGSVYSLGYVQTNERFELTEPQTDLLINPDCQWHWYVKKKILAYPVATVEAASLFPAYYRRIRRLLCKADLVVGFAAKNDTVALEKDCERYGLKPLRFQCLDMEKMCKRLKDRPDAHGLSGLVRAYCGIEPDHQHRSDGDAYATMILLKKICEMHRLEPKKIAQEFSECMISSISEPKADQPQKGRAKKVNQTANDEKTEKSEKAGKTGKPEKSGKAGKQGKNATGAPTDDSTKPAEAPVAAKKKRRKRNRRKKSAVPEISGGKSTAEDHKTESGRE